MKTLPAAVMLGSLRLGAGAAVLLGICAGMLFVPCGEARAQAQLDLEGGYVFSVSNDVQIPGTTGTRFSLTDELGSDNTLFMRGRLSYTFGERHVVSILVAQLNIPASGRVGKPIVFEGVTFPALAWLKADYRFDSYRLTYRYTVRRSERFTAGVGVTGKIRDAAITLESVDLVSRKENTGFVPLINFEVRWRFARDIWVLFEGDALAAPQGRAEDVLLAVQYFPSEKFGFKGGWRFLEGGADNEEVYSFAFLSYAVLGFYANF